jgi:pimeloyl-ACP methyl ester carboxylesterase
MIVDQKSPPSILAEHPPIAAIKNELNLNSDTMFGRHYTFFQQLADQNLAALWKQIAPRTRVLALWGEADYVSAREDHEWIADIVNRNAQGQGAFALVPDSDHAFNHAHTPADALRQLASPGPGSPPRFNPEILQVLTTWLKKTAETSPAPTP